MSGSVVVVVSLPLLYMGRQSWLSNNNLEHTDGEFWSKIDCAFTGVPHVTLGSFEIFFPLRSSVLSVSSLFRLAAAIRGGVLIQTLGEAGRLHGTAVV